MEPLIKGGRGAPLLEAYFHKTPPPTCCVKDRTLASFIKFLEGKNLVKFDVIGDSDEQFENRLKLQKYVYMAQRWGLKLPYKHSMYLYGPYSRTLTTDYYSIARNPSSYDGASSDLPPEFDREGFLESVKNDQEWLEIATTLIERSKEIRGHDELVKNVMIIKHWATRQQISDILDHLERHSLVKHIGG